MHKSILAFFVALVVALGAQSSAFMRLSAVPAGADAGIAVMLCTGDGPRTVILDAEGRPVAPRAHCPDCLAVAALPPAARAAVAPANWRRLPGATPAPQSAPRLARATPYPRAPPLSA